MLNWGLPGALWLGLLVIPIIFFYFLRMRFRRQPVSSTYIWSRLKNLNQTGEKLRWKSILLLLLQILAVIAAVTAAAGPLWTFKQSAQPGMVFLLDVSASMKATDLGPSRFDEARSLLIKEIRKLKSGTPCMVFLCSFKADKLGNPTTNKERIIRGLNSVKAGYDGFDESEVSEELNAWLTGENRVWNAYLFTDGGLNLNGKKLSSIFKGNLKTFIVGKNGRNIGLTGLRLLPGGKIQFQVYNGWLNQRTISLVLKNNDQELLKTSLNIPSGFSLQELAVSGVGKPGVYSIRLENFSDKYPIDNIFYLAVNPEQKIRVLVVSPGNPFLKAVLNHPAIDFTETNSFPTTHFTGDEWDLVIADRTVIPNGLKCNLLGINQLPPDSAFKIGEPVSGFLETPLSTHQLLRFIDWQSTRLAGGQSLKIPPGTLVLASVAGKPVMAAWEEKDRRCIISGVDFFNSDLALSGAFPIFIQNILQWSAPQLNNPLAYTIVSGEQVQLAQPESWRLSEQKEIKFNRRGRIVNLQINTPGVYHWLAGKREGYLAVNPPVGEIDISPKPLQIEQTTSKMTTSVFFEQLSLSNWPLILILLVLGFEWFIWRGWPVRKEVN